MRPFRPKWNLFASTLGTGRLSSSARGGRASWPGRTSPLRAARTSNLLNFGLFPLRFQDPQRASAAARSMLAHACSLVPAEIHVGIKLQLSPPVLPGPLVITEIDAIGGERGQGNQDLTVEQLSLNDPGTASRLE